MKNTESLKILHQLLKLSDLQSDIIEASLEGDSYATIADNLGYDYDYIKQVAAVLWQRLSTVTGEYIYKGNLRTVIHFYSQKCNRKV
jgi:hypothetical protein